MPLTKTVQIFGDWTGPQGKSAYEYAVEGGYTGSEEEFKIKLAEECSPPIINAVEGSVITVSDSSNRRIMGMKQYGWSTQNTTTGANILRDNYLELCTGDKTLFGVDGVFTVDANHGSNSEFNLSFTEGSIFADIEDDVAYYIKFTAIGFTPTYAYQITLKDSNGYNRGGSVNGTTQSFKGSEIKKSNRIQVYFYNVAEGKTVTKGSKFQMIFSKNPDCVYEPYTGGKPSPSPEYPHEIVSAGDKGNVETMVMGWSLLPLQSEDTDIEHNGIHLIYHDGRFVMSGTATINTWFNVWPIVKAGTSPKDESTIGIKSTGAIAKLYGKSTGISDITFSGGVLSVQNNFKCSLIKDTKRVYIHIPANSAVDADFELAIVADEASDWGPYKPAQSLLHTTPNGFHGIPVNYGGNYTDENGQQWIADYRDWERGVDVQCVNMVKLYASDVEYIGSTWCSIRNYKAKPDTGLLLCTHLQYIDYHRGDGGSIGVSRVIDGIRLYLGSADRTDYVDFVNNNDVWIAYVMKSPTETPIPAEELAAYRALHTNCPITTVYNDAGVYTEIEYARDTETYVNQNYVPKTTYEKLEEKVNTVLDTSLTEIETLIGGDA